MVATGVDRDAPRHLARGLLVRSILALALIAVLTATAYGFVREIVATQEGGGAVINVAGRQRMLSQRIAMLSASLAAAPATEQRAAMLFDLYDAISMMREQHRFLRDGSQVVLATPDIDALYAGPPLDVNAALDTYLAKAFRVAEALEYGTADAAALALSLVDDATGLQARLDRVVSAYERELERRIGAIRRIEAMLFAATAVVLVLEFLLIFRPAARWVRRYGEALTGEHERLRLILHSTRDALAVFDAEGRIEMVNPGFSELFDCPAGEAMHRDVRSFFVEGAALDLAAPERLGHRLEVKGRRRNGSAFAAEACVGHTEGADGRYVVSVRDVTEAHSKHEALRRIAFHDPLTGLANRLLFDEILVAALGRARRHKLGGAVMFLDLDGFKAVNDTYGHAAGDILLQEVALRLGRACRTTDTTARFAGDEFVVICEDFEADADAIDVAEKILETLKGPVAVPGGAVTITASIGIALFDGNEADPGALLRRADHAMYRAKKAGKSTWRLIPAHAAMTEPAPPCRPDRRVRAAAGE